jgi:hypothetical protein
MVVDFYETSNPLYRAWSRLLPDYIELTAGDWVLHAVWVALAFAAALGGGLLKRLGRPGAAKEAGV